MSRTVYPLWIVLVLTVLLGWFFLHSPFQVFDPGVSAIGSAVTIFIVQWCVWMDLLTFNLLIWHSQWKKKATNAEALILSAIVAIAIATAWLIIAIPFLFFGWY